MIVGFITKFCTFLVVLSNIISSTQCQPASITTITPISAGTSAPNDSRPNNPMIMKDLECKDLTSTLISYSDYPIKLPPPHNLTVVVTLFIQSFSGVDVLSQTVKTSLLVRLNWTDERIEEIYNSSTCLRDSMPVTQAYNMWYPKFSIVNSAESIDPGDLDATSVLVYRNGRLFINFEMNADVNCEMKLWSFPFDTNICFFHFVPTRDFMPSPKAGSAPTTSVSIDTEKSALLKVNKQSTSNPLFEMDRTCTILGGPTTYMFDHVYLAFEIKRNPAYYYPVVFIPTAVVSVLMAVVFVAKADDEEKLSVALTVLLSYFVVSYSLSSQLPTTSKSVPFIYYFYAYQTALSTVATLAATFIRNLNKREEEEAMLDDDDQDDGKNEFVGVESRKRRLGWCRCMSANTLNNLTLALYCLLCAGGYAIYFVTVICYSTTTDVLTIDGELNNCTLKSIGTAEKLVAFFRPMRPMNSGSP